MANENENKTPEQVTPPEKKEAPIDTFLEAAKKVKEDKVDRKELEEANEKIEKLTQFILDGKDLPEDNSKPTPSIAELQKIRHDPNSTNLQIVDATLGIREHIIKEKGYDPFALKEGEEEFGEKVAKSLKKMVEDSKGDPKTFNFLLEKGIAEDDSALMNALRKQRNSR